MQNRTLFQHDNLDILRSLGSATIDLIYLDPPFNKKKTFTAAKGSSAEGASFSDIFTVSDIKTEWVQELMNHGAVNHLLSAVKGIGGEDYNFCYLVYVGIRLLECHRVLKDTGAIHLHCDPTMSHYLKLLMDCIFAEKNFRNEIIWAYKSGGAGAKQFSKKHDVILFYSKSGAFQFRPLKEKSYNRDLKKYNFKGVEEFEDSSGWYTEVNMKDVWAIDMVGRTSRERTGYPTQKPLALLERLIASCSNVGDMVLDPFCGSGTTLIAAENLDRHWVGIDISDRAYGVLQGRLGEGKRVNFVAGL